MPRAALQNPAGGLNKIRSLRELTRFRVVERDEVNSLEQSKQLRTARLDPEVHRVACNELRLLHLFQHVQLQPRIDVVEKHERCIPECIGNYGLEVREHSQVRLERLCSIEIVAVASAPAE